MVRCLTTTTVSHDLLHCLVQLLKLPRGGGNSTHCEGQRGICNITSNDIRIRFCDSSLLF